MPTAGHAEAMFNSAKATATMYPGANILMLFMPTAAGSKKPHLAITQIERIDALSQVCEYLTESIKHDPAFTGARITFKVSPLEYSIYSYAEPATTPLESRTALFGKGANDTATIWTILKLHEQRAQRVVLTMGKDNMFDLPFWKRVQDYPTLLDNSRIFVVDRTLTDEDEAKTVDITIAAKTLRVSKEAWLKRANGSFLPVEELLPQTVTSIAFGGRSAETKPLRDFLSTINFIDVPAPAGTSSSLLRCALYGYYEGATTLSPRLAFPTHLNALLGHFAPSLPPKDATEGEKMRNPWYRSYFKTRDLVADKCGSYAADYAKFAGTAGGRKKRRSKRTKRTRRFKSKRAKRRV